MGQEVAELNGMPGEFYERASISQKNARHVYSKDFLLSVADLEYCRRLPPSIDPVVLRDAPFDSVDGGITIQALSSRGLIRRDRDSDGTSDSLPDVPEWRRPSSVSGSSLLQQGSRRSELPGINSNPRPGSAWGDNGPVRNNVERSGGGPGSAGQGRWECRSGPADRERERNRPRRELDMSESDSGGVSLGRSGWVAQEHDGLLGSGGPIGPGGLMSSQSRALERHHASGRTGRTGELYHPARVGKVSSNSCREDNDSINDETFGSEERSNEERSEKERQRRESFEQMRKEQQRHHKERLKSQSQKHGETPQSDPKRISDKKQDDNSLWDAGQNNEVLLSSSPGTPHSSSSKEDILKVHTKQVAGTTSVLSTPRLLIPPGFSKAVLQKSSSIKESDLESKAYLLNVQDESLHVVKQMDLNRATGSDQSGSSNVTMAGKDQVSDKEDDSWSHSQPKTSKFAGFFSTEEDTSQQRALWTSEGTSTTPSLFKSEKMASTLSALDNHFDTGGNHEDGRLAGMHSKSESLAVLLNSFSGSSDAGTVSSREFTLNESSSVNSLFPVNGQGHVPSMPIGTSLEDVERLITASGSNAASISSIKEPWATDHKRSNSLEDMPLHSDPATLSDKLFFSEVLGLHEASSKQMPQSKVPPVFLTCEDIEQSILAEAVQSSGNEGFVSEMGKVQIDIPQSTFTFSQLLQSSSETNKTESTVYQGHVKNASQIDTDINASRHLMSLLQKGSKDVNKASLLEQSVSPTSEDSAIYPTILGQGTKVTEERDTNSNASEIQTLETLFGKSFVNELRSVGQPVSGKSLQDDSVHGDNEDAFQSFLDVVSSSRLSNRTSGRLPVASNDGKRVPSVQTGRNSFSVDADFDVEFGKEGESFDLHNRGALMGKKNQLSSLDTDVHNEFWSNVSSHVLPRMASGQSYDNVSTSRGRSMGGSFSGDLGPQMSSPVPHQRHVLHPSGHERPFFPTSPMPSRGLHFESMHGPQVFHDNTPPIGRPNEHAHSMGMLPPDGAFHPFQAGVFHQPGHHVQGQFGQHSGGQSSIVRGAYGMPSPYPSEFAGSAQMGFDLSDRVGGPHGGGTGLSSPVDKWFSGDSMRISQGVPSFSPYQHPVSAMMPERKIAYGNSEVGTGSDGPAGMGLPLDNWFNSDMRRSSQNVPGFNPYPRPPAITPDRKLGYG